MLRKPNLFRGLTVAQNPIPYYKELIEDILLVDPSSELIDSDAEEIAQAINEYAPGLAERTVEFESDSFNLGVLVGLAQAIRTERG